MTPVSTCNKSQDAFWQPTRVGQAFALLVITIGALLLVGCAITRDKEDAQTVAAGIHQKIIAGDFAAIYHESAPPFKAVGSESEFVAGLKGLQQKFGQLKNEDQVAYQTSLDSSIGQTHLLVFDLEFDHGRARESLMFVRSAEGKMALWRLDIKPLD